MAVPCISQSSIACSGSEGALTEMALFTGLISRRCACVGKESTD